MGEPSLEFFDLDAIVANFNRQLDRSESPCGLGEFIGRSTFLTNFWTPITGREATAKGSYNLIQYEYNPLVLPGNPLVLPGGFCSREYIAGECPPKLVVGRISVEKGVIKDENHEEAFPYEVLSLTTHVPFQLWGGVTLPRCKVQLLRGYCKGSYSMMERTDGLGVGGGVIVKELSRVLPITMFPTPSGEIPEL